MPLYNAGNAYLQVVPSFKGIEALMKKELAKLGSQVDKSLGDSVAEGMGDGAKAGSQKVKEQLEKDAEDAAGAFAAKFEKRAGEMLKNLGGEVEIGAKTKDFDEAYNRIVKEVKDLSEKKIGPDFSAGKAAKEMDDLSKKMRDLEQDAPDLERQFNLRQARAEAESFFQDLKSNGATSGAEFGRRFTGALNEELRKGTEGAIKALPELQIDADSSPAEKKIADLRTLLERLHADIELGLDDGIATERLRLIMAELEKLNGYEADPSISINSGIALAKLETVRKLMDSIDGDELDVDVDVNDGKAVGGLSNIADEAGVTLSRLGYLVSFGASLGTALVPAAAAAAVAISGIGFAAAGAAAGIGSLFLAFNGIADAYKALHNYNQDVAKSGKSISQSQNRISSALDAVKSAQDSLSSARENANAREIADQQRIAKGVRDVNRARQEAVIAVRDATEAAKDADRDYTEAIQAQKTARDALNDSYKQAVRDMAALDSAIKHNALDQRQSTLDIKKAKEDLDKFLANPRATADEREQAQITYQEKLLQYQDLQRQAEKLADDQAKSNQAGIEGSKAVTAARKNLQAADRAVEKAARAQRDSQEALTKARVDGAQKIADAQQSLADAQRQQDKDRQDSQRQIAAANRSLLAANRQLSQSYVNAGVAGGDAMNTLRKKMEDLGPEARKFVYFLDRVFRPAMSSLQDSAAAGLFPSLTKGINELVTGSGFKSFNRFVFGVSKAMGDSFLYVVRQLKDPVWKTFFGYIGKTASPVIKGATIIAFNFAKGIANIMNALTGFNGGMGKGLLDFSAKFVQWSQKLTASNGFQKFMAYVRQEGPHVLGLLKQVAVFAARIVVAAAPIGALVVRAFEEFFKILNMIPLKDLTMIVGAIVALSAALLVLAAGTAIATASVGTLITLGVAALGAALAVLYQHFKPFKSVVDGTFRVVGQTILWLWKNVWIPFYVALWHGAVWLYKNVLVPVFEGFVKRVIALGKGIASLWPIVKPAVSAVGNTFLWLWRNVLKPAILGIAAGFVWLWYKVLKPALAYWNAGTADLAKQQSTFWTIVRGIFTVLAATFTFLWKAVIGPVLIALGAALVFLWKYVVVPVFTAIVVVIKVAWAILSVIFNAIVAVVKVVAAIFVWLYKNIIHPIFTLIGISVSIGWALMKVIFGLIQIALKLLGMAFVWLYNHAVKPVVGWIVAGWNWLWGWIKKIGQWIADKLSWLGGKIRDLYVKWVQPWVDKFANKVAELYNEHLKPWIDKIANLWDKYVVPAWNKSIAALGKFWDWLKNAPKAFIHWLVVDVLNNGLLSGYNKVAKFFHVKPDDVQIKLPKGFAVGGQIDGPGTGTSDSILIRASKGEHMWTAAEVDALGGHQAMYALRRAVAAGYRPPGFATGGAIDDGKSSALGIGSWLKKQAKNVGKKAVGLFNSASSFFADPISSLQALLQGLLAKAPNGVADAAKVMVGLPKKILTTLTDKLKSFVGLGPSSDAGSGTGAGGWQWQESVLKAAFGDRVTFTSTTGGGHATNSWHYKGRALDSIGPDMMAIFNWIMSHFGKTSKELIYSPAGRGIKNGQLVDIRSFYGPSVYSNHFSHVHWAYDQGGYLQPGYSMVYNGTGKPEPVLTNQQWNAIASAPRNYDGPQEVHHWETAGTTITPEWLEANQRRRDALARINRRNH